MQALASSALLKLLPPMLVIVGLKYALPPGPVQGETVIGSDAL